MPIDMILVSANPKIGAPIACACHVKIVNIGDRSPKDTQVTMHKTSPKSTLITFYAQNNGFKCYFLSPASIFHEIHWKFNRF